jgi:hypothetical protein
VGVIGECRLCGANAPESDDEIIFYKGRRLRARKSKSGAYWVYPRSDWGGYYVSARDVTAMGRLHEDACAECVSFALDQTPQAMHLKSLFKANHGDQ